MAKKKTLLRRGAKKSITPTSWASTRRWWSSPSPTPWSTTTCPTPCRVIVSRAIPEIDGFKPSHRKLLYTMYKMGLLTGARTKSANIVGQTMRLNPHGDAAIYDTMVRLSKGYGALLHPFVDSKGNFGKVYSRDMAWAASRYTEAKLAPICAELFRDIDQDTVDFVDNYDNTMKEPALLPTTFPNILVSANQGIAVGMASQLCGFNLGEVCDTTIAYLKNPDCDLSATLLAPDFPTGGEIICDGAALEEIYRTGRGSLKLRAKWRYVKEENLIEIYEIPYTTTTEAILDKVAELIKAGKAQGDRRHAGRDGPERPEAHHRPQAGHGPGQAHGRSSSAPPPSRTACPATSTSWWPGCPGSWGSGSCWRSGAPGARSPSAGGSTSRWGRRRTSSTS